MSRSRKLESILTVGDGNFSFSLSLRRKHTARPLKLVATVFEHEKESLECSQTRHNRDELLKNNVTLIYGVDGTKLEDCACLQELGLEYDKVVFNFPHTGGKSQIKKNRELLKNFFKSASKLISPTGRVVVSLCRGQGGTPVDCQSRGFENSWKIVEMATEAGLILTEVEPFNSEEFPDYRPTGYRSQEKGFLLDGALVHSFVFPGVGPSLFPPTYQHDVSFWCDSLCFDELRLREVVTQVAGNYVQSIECIDRFELAGRTSFCYRLCYSTTSSVLSRARARDMQLQVREGLQEQLGLDVR